MIYKAYNSTDDFMFQSFGMHSRIFHRDNLKDYFMISSGTNQFSMPSIWKECMNLEVESNFLYRWYTGSEGFQCITSAVKLYEDFVSSIEHDKFVKTDRRVCMTTGGSGAASHVFDYLEYQYKDCQIILMGMNYSLYERLARKHHFSCVELCNCENCYEIPDVDSLRAFTPNSSKPVFVFSLPNNPTGKMYDPHTFSMMISLIEEMNGFVVLDLVCSIISQNPPPFLESVITQHDFWRSCAVVNSFSKSDAVAGLRIGYVYGVEEIIDFCSSINADTIMNPPTFPVFPIVITCMFRCLYFNRIFFDNALSPYKIIRFFRKLFIITSAVIPDKMLRYSQFVFDHAEELCSKYLYEMFENERIIKRNISRTIEVFRSYIGHISEIEYGFNFCVWFNRELRMDELTLIKSLIDATGVAILTESSFTLRKVNQKNYMIRFSAACEENAYTEALWRMKEYMEREVL